MSTPIEVERLTTGDELAACVELQQAIVGPGARSVWHAPALTAVSQSGGLLLGARPADGEPPHLVGALIDLVADVDGYPTRHTVFHGVHPAVRNRGVGAGLRAGERTLCQRSGVDLVFWAIDPLRSVDAYLALTKLGGIATRFHRNVYGTLSDHPNAGLATDRLHVEWWIDSPRVRAIVDRGLPPIHRRLGMHRMEVITETRPLGDGTRRLVAHDDGPTAAHVLAEVPADVDRIRAEDPESARDWRLRTRTLFELLFANGYVAVGFVHEGGRSFHLFSRTDRRAVLNDS